ncbi:hypothetical protein NEOLEDRAFT_1137551 [Neolentinus lepideus HHB14362 ss-1]|uniref:Uncharacterized protein n=1 Tax=Neolentinus lepideus HHB14362 ss-1 TaxID=1314782 RepID=A0A165QR44_9AGAM|nr:hypothetical protein NEOLEDRAFT_1137551 [Neolentinus lepideus HHB14362 ss-1]
MRNHYTSLTHSDTHTKNASNQKPRPLNSRANSGLGGLATPPPSQAQGVHPSQMLISPPPEEVLRRIMPPRAMSPTIARSPVTALTSKSIASKRKRSQPFPSDVTRTPNPKPRKLSKHLPEPTHARSNSLQPASSSRACPLRISHTDPVSPSRIRHTPARYSPPREQFTPPREILLESPTKSKSKPRKSHVGARKSEVKPRLKVYVKKECPEIDLTQPAPPPSPTDDPLLLQGKPVRRRRSQLSFSHTGGEETDQEKRAKGKGKGVQLDRGSSDRPIVVDEGASPSGASHPPIEALDPFDFASIHDATDTARPTAFDFDLTHDAPAGFNSDSDSGDEGAGQEGAYTEKFTIHEVPLKGGSPAAVAEETAVVHEEDVDMDVEGEQEGGCVSRRGASPIAPGIRGVLPATSLTAERTSPVDTSRLRPSSPITFHLRPSSLITSHLLPSSPITSHLRPSSPITSRPHTPPPIASRTRTPSSRTSSPISSPTPSELGSDPIVAQRDDFVREVGVVLDEGEMDGDGGEEEVVDGGADRGEEMSVDGAGVVRVSLHRSTEPGCEDTRQSTEPTSEDIGRLTDPVREATRQPTSPVQEDIREYTEPVLEDARPVYEDTRANIASVHEDTTEPVHEGIGRRREDVGQPPVLEITPEVQDEFVRLVSGGRAQADSTRYPSKRSSSAIHDSAQIDDTLHHTVQSSSAGSHSTHSHSASTHSIAALHDSTYSAPAIYLEQREEDEEADREADKTVDGLFARMGSVLKGYVRASGSTSNEEEAGEGEVQEEEDVFKSMGDRSVEEEEEAEEEMIDRELSEEPGDQVSTRTVSRF